MPAISNAISAAVQSEPRKIQEKQDNKAAGEAKASQAAEDVKRAEAKTAPSQSKPSTPRGDSVRVGESKPSSGSYSNLAAPASRRAPERKPEPSPVDRSQSTQGPNKKN